MIPSRCKKKQRYDPLIPSPNIVGKQEGVFSLPFVKWILRSMTIQYAYHGSSPDPQIPQFLNVAFDGFLMVKEFGAGNVETVRRTQGCLSHSRDASS